MKKVVILLFALTALLSFSCNKYCNCKLYIDGELDPNYKGEFIKESEKGCEIFNEVKEIDGQLHELKCK